MDIIKLISIVICCLMIIILLKKVSADYALFASCLVNISITLFSLGILIPVFDFINNLSGNTSHKALYGIMFKSAGICMLCTVGAEICKDSGEASIASKITLAGKCTLIAYALHLIKEVFGYAQKFME